MSLKLKTFKNTAIYSSASVLGKIAGFIMLPFYTDILGSIGYGVIGMLDVGLNMLITLLSYGLKESLIRFYNEEVDENRKNLVISSGIIIVWVIAVVLFIGLSAVSKPISSLLLGDSSYFILVILALAGFSLGIAGTTASTILLIEQKSLTFSAIGLMRLIIGLSLNIYLIVILRMGLLGYFISSLVTAFASSFAFNFIAIKKCGLAFDKEIAKKVFFFEIPMILGHLFGFVSRQVERVLLRFIVNIESVGILEIAYKFPVLLSIFFSIPFMQSWEPRRMEIADQENAPEEIASMFTYFLFVLLLLGVLLAVNVKDIIQILTPKEFWPAYKIAFIEIIFLILRDCNYHFTFGLLYGKNTKKLAFINSVTSGIKIPISLTAITFWGLSGAAYAALITEIIRCTWLNRCSDYHYHIPFEWKKIRLMVIAAVSICVTVNLLEVSETSFVAGMHSSFMNPIMSFLNFTGLATIKNGVLIKMVSSRLNSIIALFVNSLLCIPMLFVAHIVYPELAEILLTKLGVKVALLKNTKRL